MATELLILLQGGTIQCSTSSRCGDPEHAKIGTCEIYEYLLVCCRRKDTIGAFLDAVSQNESIRTVVLERIYCSARAVQKLLDRKIRWVVDSCRFDKDLSSSNGYTCYVEELIITDTCPSVTDSMSSLQAWPHLRLLDMSEVEHNVHFMENVIRGAPMLQELTLRHFRFHYPAILRSYAMLVCENASKYSSLLKWHLDSCDFFPNTIAMLEQISTWEMAKSMRVTLKLSRENCQVLRSIMSDRSCVGALGVNYDVMQSRNHLMPDGNPILEMLPLLQINHISSACRFTCVKLTMNTKYFEGYRKVIESIPQWTHQVKALFLQFIVYDCANHHQICTELSHAVQNNMYLLFEVLDIDIEDYNKEEKEEIAEKKCHAILDWYCECNHKL